MTLPSLARKPLGWLIPAYPCAPGKARLHSIGERSADFFVYLRTLVIMKSTPFSRFQLVNSILLILAAACDSCPCVPWIT